MDALEEETRALYIAHAPAVHHHLWNLVGDEAEAADLLHEALVRYVNYRRRGRQIERPRSFLYRVASRLAYKHLRKRERREGLTHRLPQPSELESPDAHLQVQQLWANLWPRLDPKAKMVAKALIFDGLTPEKIGPATGLSRSTVKRRLKKIRSLATRYEKLDQLESFLDRIGSSGPHRDEGEGGDP